MPMKKRSHQRRTQNLPSQQGSQPVAAQDSGSDMEGNIPAETSEPGPTLGRTHSVASSSKVTLEIYDEYADTQSHCVPQSPDNLANDIENLTLGAQDQVVLEDPPDDVEDPADNRNPLSLGDYDEDEALDLSPLPAEDLQDDEELNETSDSPNRRLISRDQAKILVAALNEIIKSSFHGHGKTRASTLGDVVLTRLRFMAGTLNLIAERGLGLIDASLTAAVVFGRGQWAARQVRKWIQTFQKEERLPTNVYGTWNGSVMEDEDLSAAIQHWLREQGKYVRARDVIDFFGTAAAARFASLIDAPPSIRTAQRWMQRMGYTWMKEHHGQFADGHERDDVKDYRVNFYVPEWTKLERRMRSWDSEGKEVPPKLAEGERVVVVWFHDESTFYAHDRRLTRWVHEDETAGIYKKGEGVSLMVADFISADYGWLRSKPALTSAAQNAPVRSAAEGESLNDARVIFRAGKSRDGWFRTVDVAKQLSRAMSIVKKQYPNEDHVFIFDNATIHTKLPETAPNVAKMTLGPSKKVGGDGIGPSGEKIKVQYAPAILPDGSIQQFYHPPDHHNEQLKDAFKGLAVILGERGVSNARKLKLVCPATDSHNKQGCPPSSTNCCAYRTMMNQPDILAQKSILQLQAAAEGFSVLYLPKYHCELNPIEQCWGAAKRVYRDFPPSSLEADLRKNMLSALESVTLTSIRRFAARSQRFVHHYGRGLSGKEAAWATKQYRGHRIIPDSLLEAMDGKD